MATNSKLKAIITLAVFTTFIAPNYTHADEHEWLKSSNFEKIFVCTDFTTCAIGEKQLTKSLEGVMIRSRIKAFVTEESPFIWVVNDKGERVSSFIHKLVKNQKIFLYVIVQCKKSDYFTYYYKIDINFAILDDDGNILLHNSPKYGVWGTNTIDGINTLFRTQVEDAVADYLSANMQK